MKVKEFKHPIKILIEAPVNPSERISKVNHAISNLILHPVDSTETKNDKITLNFDDIQIMHSIYQQFRIRKILGVARRLLHLNQSNNTSWLFFNKQAAFAKVVVLCGEYDDSPLGPIKISFSSVKLEEFIEWIAPRSNH